MPPLPANDWKGTRNRDNTPIDTGPQPLAFKGGVEQHRWSLTETLYYMPLSSMLERALHSFAQTRTTEAPLLTAELARPQGNKPNPASTAVAEPWLDGQAAREAAGDAAAQLQENKPKDSPFSCKGSNPKFHLCCNHASLLSATAKGYLHGKGSGARPVDQLQA